MLSLLSIHTSHTICETSPTAEMPTSQPKGTGVFKFWVLSTLAMYAWFSRNFRALYAIKIRWRIVSMKTSSKMIHFWGNPFVTPELKRKLKGKSVRDLCTKDKTEDKKTAMRGGPLPQGFLRLHSAPFFTVQDSGIPEERTPTGWMASFRLLESCL